jgi:hypothetical protein
LRPGRRRYRWLLHERRLGELPGQAALYGVLALIEGFGLDLLEVRLLARLCQTGSGK